MRGYYDIESLWTLGPDNDPKSLESDKDPYALSAGQTFVYLGSQDTVLSDKSKCLEITKTSSNKFDAKSISEWEGGGGTNQF